MSATTITAQSQAAAPEVTAERFLEQLWGVRPGQQSPRITPVERATAGEHMGEGVAAWLYRMWGIRPARSERRAA